MGLGDLRILVSEEGKAGQEGEEGSSHGKFCPRKHVHRLGFLTLLTPYLPYFPYLEASNTN